MPKNKKEKIYQKPTEEQLQYLRNKSKVLNTQRSTQNWILKFQKYRLDIGLEGVPEDINETSKLEMELCDYFTVAEKEDGSSYSVSSLLAAIQAINRFYNSSTSKIKPVNLCDWQAFPNLWEILDGKIKDLSEKGYSETNGSDLLSIEEIQQILQHEATLKDTLNGLLNWVFFYNAIFLALRGGEHYTLMANHFQKRKDGGFNVFIYKSKTNQRGLKNLDSADKISIPTENSEIIANYKKYFLNRPIDANPEFYLQPIDTKSAQNYEVSTITRHHSLSFLARYERPKDGVQKSALVNLIDTVNSKTNTIAPQPQSTTILPNKDLYHGFKTAQQIYQGKL
ncbi:2260_t:CDS:2, partial [Racocetra fulgida]